MPSLVPERRRCPPKWWVPFQGGTILGETRRKGETTISCLGDGKPGGKEGDNNIPSRRKIMNIQWFPGHMTKAIRMMEENLRLVDALIYVID